MQIQPVLAEGAPAIDLARATCAHWGVFDFEAALEDHFRSGFVAVMPHLLLLAKAVILEDGRRAWHITHAVGHLPLLRAVLPFDLEWVSFRRRRDSRLRVYKLTRLTHLAFLDWKRKHE